MAETMYLRTLFSEWLQEESVNQRSENMWKAKGWRSHLLGNQISAHKGDLPHCCTLRGLMRTECLIQHGPAFCVETEMCLWVTIPLSLSHNCWNCHCLDSSFSRDLLICMSIDLTCLHVLYIVTCLDVYRTCSHHTANEFTPDTLVCVLFNLFCDSAHFQI